MVQYPIKISEENSKNSRFYGYLKLVLILSHFRARTLYTRNLAFFLSVINSGIVSNQTECANILQTF